MYLALMSVAMCAVVHDIVTVFRLRVWNMTDARKQEFAVFGGSHILQNTIFWMLLAVNIVHCATHLNINSNKFI